MKKFFVALTILLCTFGSDVDAAQFTKEQQNQMLSIAVQPSAATLNVNVVAFQKNFNDFIDNYVKETNAGADADKFKQVFMIGEQNFVTNGQNVLFVKNFMNTVAIVGSVDENGNFKTLNLFGAAIDDNNETMIHALVLNAFIKGISPDLDAQALFAETNGSPDTPIVKGDVKFSFSTVDNLDIVSVTAK